MIMATKKAIVPAGVGAVIAAMVLGTPEIITLVMLGVAGFASALIAVIAFWMLGPVSSWNALKQQLSIWLIATAAAFAGVEGCFILLAPVFPR
jgi:hypothetical protein